MKYYVFKQMKPKRSALFACFILLISPPIAMGALPDDLVAYWPLDGDATDASGNGLDGRINGNVQPVEDREDNPDGALEFTGAETDNVEIEDRPELQIKGAMTLAAWVWLNGDSTNNARIVAKQAGGGSRSWSLNIEANVNGVPNPGTFHVASDGNTIAGISDDDSLPTDTWVHIAGVYRPGDVLELYIDGNLAATNRDAIPAEQFSTNGQPVRIGARNACGNCGWPGRVDDVVIWQRDLSAGEIQQVMNNGPLAVKPTGKLATTWGTLKR